MTDAANAGARRPAGILCPTCLKKLRTVRVRPLANGSVRRLKRCLRCPYRCTTYERPAAER